MRVASTLRRRRLRVGDRLHARCGVHEVAGDHALPFGADRDCSLAGEHAGAGRELRRADFVPERRYSRNEVESCAYGALGIVLGCRGRPPDGHDGVADELLDRAAVELDETSARVEVAREELTHLLGVTSLREHRETDEIGEEHGDEPALCDRRRRRCRRCRCCRSRERRPAFAAELHPRRI